MRKKRHFPGTTLDNKISKSVDVQIAKAESFSQLCKFFGLDEKQLLMDHASPWRELAEKMVEHLIPGFQVNRSGNKKVTGLHTDLDIYQKYQIRMDFAHIGENGIEEQPFLSSEEAMADLAIVYGLSIGQIKAAIARSRKAEKENMDVLYNPYSKEPLPKAFLEQAHNGWSKKNRKQDHNKKLLKVNE